MPRKRTGTIAPVASGGYRARLRLGDGSRHWVRVPDGYTEERARGWAQAQQEVEDAAGGILKLKTAAVPTGSAETFEAWCGRWVESRKAKGLGSTSHDRGRLGKWIFPHIGAKPIAGVSSRDLAAIVQSLDGAIQRGVTSPKNAQNIWGVVTKAFADASRSKVAELRVRDDNPAVNVEGPDRGHAKSKTYLYPNEFTALLSCSTVPVRWARIFALATYLYIRRGELEALDWEDVHEDEGFIRIHRATDEDRKLKAPKTKRARNVPIEPTLRPLLRVMREESAGEGPVVGMPPRSELAKRLRRYMLDAGVTRAALHDDQSETSRQMVYHALRDTGITWRAIRGDEPLKIQRAAGHSTMGMTDKYIAEAEAFRAGFGGLFPELPERLLHPLHQRDWSTDWSTGTVVRVRQLVAASIERRPHGDSKTVATAEDRRDPQDSSVIEAPRAPKATGLSIRGLPNGPRFGPLEELFGDLYAAACRGDRATADRLVNDLFGVCEWFEVEGGP